MASENHQTPPAAAHASPPTMSVRQIDESQDIFEQIFRYSIIPTIIHDMNMDIVDANDSALAEFGYTMDELKSMKVFDLHTADELEHSASVLNDMKSAKKLSVETRFKRKDGSVFDAEATPCQYVIGNTPVIHVFINDITERKRAENRINRFNLELQSQVAQRTLEIERASEELKKSNEYLKNFAYMASHDLQAPLRHIKFFANVLAEDHAAELSDAARDKIDSLKAAAGRLQQRVEALLLFSRVQRAELEWSKLDLNALVREVESDLEIELTRAGGHLDYKKLPVVYGDAKLLPLVIQNLVENSLKFRGDSPPRIAIAAHVDEGRATVTLVDNGCGFDPQYNDRIFKVFERLSSKSSGSGIGLAVCRLIMERHEGTIEASGRPAAGATFTLSWPQNPRLLSRMED